MPGAPTGRRQRRVRPHLEEDGTRGSAGTIGQAILGDLLASDLADIVFVACAPNETTPDLGAYRGPILTDLDAAMARPVDLLVEAAVPGVLARVAPGALAHGDVCGFSCTGFADPSIEHAVQQAAAASRHRFLVPHGAILALDGLADGREVIETVSMTTNKSGPSLGLPADANGVVFEGPVREACRLFPRNVHVHAAVALAGIGFDRTVSRVIAVPSQVEMEHRLEVAGPGFAWDIKVASRSLGGVTGAYTPRSAIGSIRRILAHDGLAVA